ncbi:MAG: hypothetical protein HQK51_02445 [Oligoflexia bacterium]|nr:hypothetical protein [Oligoflexia bacterium]
MSSNIGSIESKIVLVAFFWCVIALFVQLFRARKKSAIDAREYSRPAKCKNIFKAIIYNFTKAMSPYYKESARLHPLKFIMGITMHLGIFLSILKFIQLLFFPWTISYNLIISSSILAFAIFITSALSGVFLLFNRIFSSELRSISNLDDYISIILSILILVSSALNDIFLMINNDQMFLIYALLFFYIPVGKLRHAIFFFAVRVDFAKKLGHRGVYPL